MIDAKTYLENLEKAREEQMKCPFCGTDYTHDWGEIAPSGQGPEFDFEVECDCGKTIRIRSEFDVYVEAPEGEEG